MHPDQIMPELAKNPNAYFADSLIKEAVKIDIGKVYDYAQANNALGDRIAITAIQWCGWWPYCYQ